MSLDQYLGLIITSKTKPASTKTASDSIKQQLEGRYQNLDLTLDNDSFYEDGKLTDYNKLQPYATSGKPLNCYEWFTTNPSYNLNNHDQFLNYLGEQFENKNISLDEIDTVIDNGLIEDIKDIVFQINNTNEPKAIAKELFPITEGDYNDDYFNANNTLIDYLETLQQHRDEINHALKPDYEAMIIYLPWWW